MNNLNFVSLIGRLTHDNELRTNTNGKSFLSNSIAVQRSFKNANGDYDTDFINVAFSGKTAEFVNEHFHKGDVKKSLLSKMNIPDYAKIAKCLNFGTGDFISTAELKNALAHSGSCGFVARTNSLQLSCPLICNSIIGFPLSEAGGTISPTGKSCFIR